MGAYKSLPGVDKLLASGKLGPLLSRYGREPVVFCIRRSLEHFRNNIKAGHPPPESDEILNHIGNLIGIYAGKHLRRVINATGVIIHTNLGRAPYGKEFLAESFEVLRGYNNLEFDLETGDRGNRNDHARDLLRYLTGAEDILVVNNAAAAVMMILRTFARNREVIVSRGELIEIGGSFRIPDIMAASDCIMVEVGTTNRTRISDYEKAISDRTAMLFKAHKSNYVIKGFTEEVSADDLSDLGRRHGIPVLYDLGSGLLRKSDHPALAGEPDVKDALSTGADLVCFSGDKLLGGPQAGIIAGKTGLIEKLRKEPVLRALRVCKTTLALLETAGSYYLREKETISKNQIFKTLNRSKPSIRNAARKLQLKLNEYGILSEVVPSKGQCGGGSLPDACIDSFAVMLKDENVMKNNYTYSEQMYRQLLRMDIPVIGVLRKGHLYLDMLTVENREIDVIASAVAIARRTICEP